MKSITAYRAIAGSSLVEVLVSTAVTGVLAVGMLIGMVTIQRSFRASQHHAQSQIEQARLLDYIARDLRRALTVSVDTFEGSERLNVTIPDFYEQSGLPSGGSELRGDVKARDPVIQRGRVIYGDPARPVRISYFKSGTSLVRSVNEVAQPLATDVESFILDYTDSGKQIIGVSVSFVPRFQLNARDVSALRVGTATYASTLLRNKRQ